MIQPWQSPYRWLIGDSRGYKAALALGGEGVQVGTRIIASKECLGHINYKDIIVQAPESGTELVSLSRFRVRALLTPSPVRNHFP